jgi:hypothetical protein
MRSYALRRHPRGSSARCHAPRCLLRVCPRAQPLHVVVITDGELTVCPPDRLTDPALGGEALCAAQHVIWNALAQAISYHHAGALAVQFAHVGSSTAAAEWLCELDNHPIIGPHVDSTSAFELEREEVRVTSGKVLTPAGWRVKLLSGAIDDALDDSG